MVKTKLLSVEQIADGLLEHMASLQGDKGMRGQSLKRNGQYYVFDGGNLKKTFEQLKNVKLKGQEGNEPIFDSTNLDINGLIKDIDDIWKAEEKKNAKNVIRYKELHKNRHRVKAKARTKQTGAKIYIVLSSNRVSTVNKSKINPLIIERMEKSLKKDTAAIKRLKAAPIKDILGGNQRGQTGKMTTLDGKTEAGNLGTQLGHGEHGKPVAAMQAEAVGAWARANKHNMPEGQFEQIQDALITIESVLGCSLSYTNVKEGKLTLEADLIISNQMTIDNKADAQAMEQPIAAWLMTYLTGQEVKGQYFGHWASAVVERKVLTQLLRGWKMPGVTVIKNLPKLTKLDTKAERASKKKKVKQKVAMIVGWGASGLVKQIVASTKSQQYSKLGVRKGQQGTPSKEDRQKALQIIAQANLVLKKKVQERMIYPALENITGRFAGSVQLMNLTQTARGLKAQYEYDMEHYGTFEPGNKQGSRARDPNPLIEEAITRATQSSSGVIPRLFQRIG